MKRVISYLLALVMLFGMICSASAETITTEEMTTASAVDAIVEQYGGDDPEELRELINSYLPEYEANGSAQQFLAMIVQKLRTEETFDIIDIMNVRQVMAGFPEGPLPSGDNENYEGETSTMSTRGEPRANRGGIRPEIAVGQAHTVYLTAQGGVLTWGKYYSGEQYIAVNDTGLLVILDSLTSIIDIAAGGGSALALKNDGTVWAWGANQYGQLGNNSTTDSVSPVQVETVDGNLTNVTAIAMGEKNGFAITADGAVYAWGDNTYGQLGNNSTTQSSVAVRVVGANNEGYLSGIKSISVGNSHVLALKINGEVYGWGDNTYGQIGDGTNVNRLYPVSVTMGGQVVSSIKNISAGGKHSLALTSRGKVYAWGANIKGQLGIGSTISSNTPMLVSGVNGETELTFVTDIAAGYEFSAARRSNGHIAAWGDNYMAQLGDGTIRNKAVPTETDRMEMAVSLYAGHNFLVVQKSNGQIWGIGANDNLQLGDPYPATRSKNWLLLYTPYAKIVEICSSSLSSTMLATDGTVYTAGSNAYGQLGNGTTTKSTRPIAVLGPDGTGKINNVTEAKQGYAIKGDGTLWYWGVRYYVNNTATYIWLPTQSKDSTGANVGNMKDFSSGFIKGDGSIWNWNSTTRVLEPTNTYAEETELIDGALQIDGDLMLKYDGTVWTKGSNTYGELGINESNTNYVASDWVQVKGLNGNGYLTNIVQISSGLANLALAADGTVYAWGSNFYGNCGNNSEDDQFVPVKVKGVDNSGYLTNATQIKNFGSHSYAFLTDGTIVGWGSNWDGQMGNGGVTVQYNYPRAVFTGGKYATDDYGSSYADAYEISVNRWIYGRRENTKTDYFTFVHRGGENVTITGYLLDSDNTEISISLYYYDESTNSYRGLRKTDGVYTLTEGQRYYIQAFGNAINVIYRFRINSEIDETIDESADEFDDGSGDDFGDGTGSATGNDFDDASYGSATTDTTFSYSQNVTTTYGTEYIFILSADNTSGMPESITFEYDSTYFDVVTLCGLVSEPVTTTGAVDGTGITITAASAGTATFTRNITVTDGKTWDGAVNIIRLKAKKAGATVVSYEAGGA
ncbi:MAG: hypothetical protein IJP38_05880 [Oscillospiraceae bacterium]|nr:hypothetical protein [Oscillospiraceae bacterium]